LALQQKRCIRLFQKYRSRYVRDLWAFSLLCRIKLSIPLIAIPHILSRLPYSRKTCMETAMQDIVVDVECVNEELQASPTSGPVRAQSLTARRRKKSEARRAVKACVQCKSRKQRCSGPSSIPCARCAAAKRSCSFSFGIDDAYREDLEDSATASLDLSVRTIAQIKFE
jgi:hypothetical protein